MAEFDRRSYGGIIKIPKLVRSVVPRVKIYSPKTPADEILDDDRAVILDRKPLLQRLLKEDREKAEKRKGEKGR